MAVIRRAKAACSRQLYLVFTSAKDLLMKNTGLCLPSSFSLNNVTLTIVSETAKKTKRVLLVSGFARIGGSAKYCLIWIKARSHSSFHLARLAPLRAMKNGFKRSMNQEINRPKAANLPVS